MLALPRQHGCFVLDTDASDVGMGAVLSQLQEGEERVIAYESKRFTKQQRRYCVTRRELLAVHSAVHHFRHYLLGGEFLVRTDHNSLRWLFNFKSPEGQLARWLEVLSQYDFKIVHRPGNKHSNADALSRRGCQPDNCSCFVQNVPLNELPCGGCAYCSQRQRDWSTFQDVDDVVALSAPNRTNAAKVRAVTLRSSAKKLSEYKRKQKEAKERVTVMQQEGKWIGKYTAQDISRLQREDPDLDEVHRQLDKDGNEQLDREELASKSPRFDITY